MGRLEQQRQGCVGMLMSGGMGGQQKRLSQKKSSGMGWDGMGRATWALRVVELGRDCDASDGLRRHAWERTFYSRPLTRQVDTGHAIALHGRIAPAQRQAGRPPLAPSAAAVGTALRANNTSGFGRGERDDMAVLKGHNGRLAALEVAYGILHAGPERPSVVDAILTT